MTGRDFPPRPFIISHGSSSYKVEQQQSIHNKAPKKTPPKKSSLLLSQKPSNESVCPLVLTISPSSVQSAGGLGPGHEQPGIHGRERGLVHAEEGQREEGHAAPGAHRRHGRRGGQHPGGLATGTPMPENVISKRRKQVVPFPKQKESHLFREMHSCDVLMCYTIVKVSKDRACVPFVPGCGTICSNPAK